MSAHLNFGLLEAYLDAYGDFFINDRPFDFIGDAGIDIGVRYSMDLLFVTTYISINSSALLSSKACHPKDQTKWSSGCSASQPTPGQTPTQSVPSTSPPSSKCSSRFEIHGNWLSKQRESKIQPYDFYNQSSNSCPNHFRELMIYFQFPSLPSTMLLFCEIKS